MRFVVDIEVEERIGEYSRIAGRLRAIAEKVEQLEKLGYNPTLGAGLLEGFKPNPDIGGWVVRNEKVEPRFPRTRITRKL